MVVHQKQKALQSKEINLGSSRSTFPFLLFNLSQGFVNSLAHTSFQWCCHFSFRCFFLNRSRLTWLIFTDIRLACEDNKKANELSYWRVSVSLLTNGYHGFLLCYSRSANIKGNSHSRNHNFSVGIDTQCQYKSTHSCPLFNILGTPSCTLWSK